MLSAGGESSALASDLPTHQHIVLRDRDVVGMDRQPDTLLHLRGKPSGFPGALAPLLPGAPEKDTMTIS